MSNATRPAASTQDFAGYHPIQADDLSLVTVLTRLGWTWQTVPGCSRATLTTDEGEVFAGIHAGHAWTILRLRGLAKVSRAGVLDDDHWRLADLEQRIGQARADRASQYYQGELMSMYRDLVTSTSVLEMAIGTEAVS